MIRMIGYREVCPFEHVPNERRRCVGSPFAENRLAAWEAYRGHMAAVHGIPVGAWDAASETTDVAWSAEQLAAGGVLGLALAARQAARFTAPTHDSAEEG